MVEISTSSGDEFSNGRLSGSYGLPDRGHVIKLFTRSKKSNCECNALSEEKPDLEPFLKPELVSLLSRHSLSHLRETIDLGGPRTSIDVLGRCDATDSGMAMSHDESDSSRECLYRTPAATSSFNLSVTSPELKLQEFEQELEKLKAERNRQRAALREQVLSEIDIPAKFDCASSQSTNILIPKNPCTVSEHDGQYSVSSRSSEENLTFLDATDDLTDDQDEIKTDSEYKKKTNNSESVDFSFLHSVYRGRGKHEEAILFRMKYAGNSESRTERSDDMGSPDTASSNSILGTIPPSGTDSEIVKEYTKLREKLRKYGTEATKLRFCKRVTSPKMKSATVSGSTTPRQRSDSSSKRSSYPTSKKSSETSVGTAPLRTESSARVMSLPQSPSGTSSNSEHSSTSSSRTASPPPKTLESRPSSANARMASPTRSINKYPMSRSSPLGFQQSDFQKDLPESPQRCRHSLCEYTTAEFSQRNSSHNYDFLGCAAESSQFNDRRDYSVSECGTGTEDDLPFRTRSERSDRSSQRNPPVEIPITIDGRLVYPEVVIAEDNRTAQIGGPLGLLDKVKSFAKICGPEHTENKEQSPVRLIFSDGNPAGERASVKLNATLLSRLTCVECGSLCTPPVAMCVWGHIICEECRPVSLWENHGKCWCRKRCPQCSGDMLSQPCEVWSNIARSLLFPCRYASNGCRDSHGLTPTEKLLHEETCLWRQLRCRCSGCSWRGVWHQMRAHVIQIHLSNATRADWYRFVGVGGATSIGRSSDLIVLPANELVLLHSLAVIGEHRYLLQYLYDDKGGGGALLFVPRFKLRVVSKDGKSEIEIRGEAVPMQHDVERALRSGKCFRLSSTPFGWVSTADMIAPEKATVQLCLEKGRLSVL